MKSQVRHTVWSNIPGEAAGEISNWSLVGVKGLTREFYITQYEELGLVKWKMIMLPILTTSLITMFLGGCTFLDLRVEGVMTLWTFSLSEFELWGLLAVGLGWLESWSWGWLLWQTCRQPLWRSPEEKFTNTSATNNSFPGADRIMITKLMGLIFLILFYCSTSLSNVLLWCWAFDSDHWVEE